MNYGKITVTYPSRHLAVLEPSTESNGRFPAWSQGLTCSQSRGGQVNLQCWPYSHQQHYNLWVFWQLTLFHPKNHQAMKDTLLFLRFGPPGVAFGGRLLRWAWCGNAGSAPRGAVGRFLGWFAWQLGRVDLRCTTAKQNDFICWYSCFFDLFQGFEDRKKMKQHISGTCWTRETDTAIRHKFARIGWCMDDVGCVPKFAIDGKP